MLIRFVVENFLSFSEQKEFNLLPKPKYGRMGHHRYKIGSINLLKQSVIYGANAAGKSNLVKGLRVMQELVTSGKFPVEVDLMRFRLDNESDQKPITLAVEFFVGELAFTYAIQFGKGGIQTEELYRSGLGFSEDKMIFERTSHNGKDEIKFPDDFSDDSEKEVRAGIINNGLLRPTKCALRLLDRFMGHYLPGVEEAKSWFDDALTIISAGQKVSGLAHELDQNMALKAYANDVMRSYHVGVSGIEIEHISPKAFFGEDDARLTRQLEQKLRGLPLDELPVRHLQLKSGEEVSVVLENDNLIVKRIRILHRGVNGDHRFLLHEESDGTRRLLDFIPAFLNVVGQRKVYIIDEIERSIHPLVAKALIRKFSEDQHTTGQLIFTTHESNLLDQKIFRQDEIWFAEKDVTGATDLYPLTKFREHHTIDIQKGYLNGRYGAIPFLGNLEDLNWHRYDTVA